MLTTCDFYLSGMKFLQSVICTINFLNLQQCIYQGKCAVQNFKEYSAQPPRNPFMAIFGQNLKSVQPLQPKLANSPFVLPANKNFQLPGCPRLNPGLPPTTPWPPSTSRLPCRSSPRPQICSLVTMRTFFKTVPSNPPSRYYQNAAPQSQAALKSTDSMHHAHSMHYFRPLKLHFTHLEIDIHNFNAAQLCGAAFQ